jgi:excisionase family DNA binding protein
MEPLMLKIDEAAKLLRVGRSKLYQLIHAGEIPSRRVGKSLRIPRHELLKWAGVPQPQPSPAPRAVSKVAV